MARADDNEPITPEWLTSIHVFPGENDGSERSKEHEVRIDAGNAVGRTEIMGNEPGESIYLGIHPETGFTWVECYDEDKDKTVGLVDLPTMRTRGEFRLLLRALRAWDAETQSD